MYNIYKTYNNKNFFNNCEICNDRASEACFRFSANYSQLKILAGVNTNRELEKFERAAAACPVQAISFCWRDEQTGAAGGKKQ